MVLYSPTNRLRVMVPQLSLGGEVDVKPYKGSPPCTCPFIRDRTTRVVNSALRVIRTRFRLELSELPNLKVEELDCYLLHLLGGPATRPLPRSISPRTGAFLRLGRMDRWSLAHSCASIKRNLSFSPCKAHLPASTAPLFFTTATQSDPPSASSDYLRFVRKQVKSFFPFGWDKHLYPSFVTSHVPNDTQRYDGVKSSRYWAKNSNKEEFEKACLTGRLPPHITEDFRLRLSEVPTSGKVRKLGVPTHNFELLAPLHKAVYQQLTKQKWLLRGPPKGKRIKSVCTKEFQTSVDLVSATDGLMLDVADAALGAALSKACCIPGKIRELAHLSLRAQLEVKGVGKGEVTFGQMMGTYLSFPLLCIQSYLAARWAGGKDAEILINGDDCLMSSNYNDVIARYPPGFQINYKKTTVKANVAEINSTAFVNEGQRWREVRHLRRGGYDGSINSLQSFAGACRNAGPKWVNAFVQSRIGRSKRLLGEDLGLPSSNHMVYSRSKHMISQGRWKALVPKEKVQPDERLQTVFERPGGDAQVAVSHLLFNDGRLAKDPNKNSSRQKDPEILVINKVRLVQRINRHNASLPPGRAKFCSTLSYEPTEKKKEKTERWFITSDYETIDEAARRKECMEGLSRWVCDEEAL